MKYEFLVIDFETQDPYIDLQLGSGWVYGDIYLCGCAIYFPDGTSRYIADKKVYKKIIEQTDTLIVFKANYDIGILHMLGMDIEKFKIIDVLLMAKLHDSVLFEYTLNSLSKKYLGDVKSEAPLGDIATNLGLVKSRSMNPVKVAKRNMRMLQEHHFDVVAEYAEQDVKLTFRLYQFFLEQQTKEYYLLDFFSDLQKVLILNRAQGVCIDLIQLLKVQNKLQESLLDAQLALNDFNEGLPVNVYSSKDVVRLLRKFELPVGATASGKDGANKQHLESIDHPVCHAILRVRAVRTLKNNFIDKIVETQKYTIKVSKEDFGSKAQHGFIYPEINPLGASATGRFSSIGGIQQIPKRNKEFAGLIRSVFIAHPSDLGFSSLDFSAQEPRLQVHYAAVCQAPGALELVERFKKDPLTDLHTLASEGLSISRDFAKIINLGLSYGMGPKTLARMLGCSELEAVKFRDAYFKKFPYLQILITQTARKLKQRGYIKTLLGRHLHLDKPSYRGDGQSQTYEYKGINKLIQGSAADQTMLVHVELYRQKIPFLFSVHDEICISVKYDGHVADVKRVMESATPLQIPVIAEAKTGSSWGTVKSSV